MSLSRTIILGSLVMVLIASCGQHPNIRISVKNELNTERSNEVVEITKIDLGLSSEELLESYELRTDNGSALINQYVDQNGDGSSDVILFAPTVKAKDVAEFSLVKLEKKEEFPDLNNTCFSRFVPERTDDYAWENDRVAFRTFGPTAQQMKEQGIKGGTLTSGIDCWLKRVDYPIIDRWYEKYSSGAGTYHNDDGEGLDNFHVGVSRGCGGIAVRVNNDYSFSKNFSKWEKRFNGPLRTSFSLGYEDWTAGDQVFKETKNVSLDKGSNLSKYVTNITGTKIISVGLTLHENDGEVTVNEEEGWISYWQPHDESELATAIISAPNSFIGFDKYETDQKDLSNVYAHLLVVNGYATYYSGFAWKESGQFTTKKDWETYISQFSAKLRSPMIVTVSH